jgi:hypothetical protein
MVETAALHLHWVHSNFDRCWSQAAYCWARLRVGRVLHDRIEGVFSAPPSEAPARQ